MSELSFELVILKVRDLTIAFAYLTVGKKHLATMALSSTILKVLVAVLALALAATSEARIHEKAWSSVLDGNDIYQEIESLARASGLSTRRELQTPHQGPTKVSKPVATDDAAAADDAAEKKSSKKDAAETEDDDNTLRTIVDDAFGTNQTAIIPPEPEQPGSWPGTVMIIFLILAVVLLGITVFRNWRKRSQYQDVPTTSLIV